MTLDFIRQSDYFWALLPEIVLSLWAMGVLLLDVFQKGSRSEPSRPVIAWLALAGLVVTAVVNLTLLRYDSAAETSMIAIDGFRVFTNFIFLLVAALTLLISTDYLKRRGIFIGEYFVLVLFATVGMMLMAASRDLILLFLALELMSVAIYVLVGFDRRDPRSAEGSLKYFLLGAFASGFLLYGIALIFGASGSTNLAVIGPLVSTGLATRPMFLVGAALLLVGLSFKVAAVPFHVWTPDAYDGAPTPVTAFMSTGTKAAAFAAIIRVFAVAFVGAYAHWGLVFAGMALLTMFGANLVALTQGSVKRMLAYSSIAHAGYLLVAVLSASGEGASAFLFYLVTYTIMQVGAFGIVIANHRDGRDRIALDDYAGLGWQQPFLGAAFAILLLSLAGFPLTAGFIGKLYILRAAVSSGNGLLAVALVLASVISYFYYLRVIIVMYMRPAATADVHAGLSLAGPARFAIGFAAVAMLVLFLYPSPLLDAAQQSVASLFPAPGGLFGMRP